MVKTLLKNNKIQFRFSELYFYYTKIKAGVSIDGIVENAATESVKMTADRKKAYRKTQYA